MEWSSRPPVERFKCSLAGCPRFGDVERAFANGGAGLGTQLLLATASASRGNSRINFSGRTLKERGLRGSVAIVSGATAQSFIPNSS
jgi:hypothetical protein